MSDSKAVVVNVCGLLAGVFVVGGVWGRNLFDETHISDIIPIEGLGFDLFSVGAPRTAGVYARYNY